MAEVSTTRWPFRLAVMRHAESLATERRKHLEQVHSHDVHLGLEMRDVDVPLTTEGRENARRTGVHLDAWEPFDVVYVSPYKRTLETAAEVLAGLRHKPLLVKEERLREKEWGVFEGLTRRGIREKYPEEDERRKRVGKYFFRPAGGESYADVNLRVHSFIGTMVREHPRQRVLVITHQVVVLSIRKLLERLEEEDIIALDRQDEARPASLLVYELGERDGIRDALVRKHWNLILHDRGAAPAARAATGGTDER